MRSRNGNRTFVLAGIAVTLSFGADHYYIGYRLTTKNIQPFSETFALSKAMQPCSSTLQGSALVLERSPDEPLKTLLERNQNPFLEYALSETVRINTHLFTLDHQPQALDTLTLPTQCYAVEFNDDSVTITLIK